MKTVRYRFGSGRFLYGGKIKIADHVDFIAWLKDEHLLYGDNRKLKAAPLLGYIKDQRQWLINKERSKCNFRQYILLQIYLIYPSLNLRQCKYWLKFF